jgi:hypothetical protein
MQKGAISQVLLRLSSALVALSQHSHAAHHLPFILPHSRCPPWLCSSSSTQRSSVGSTAWGGLTLTRAMSVRLVEWHRLPCRAGFRERKNGKRDCPQLVTASAGQQNKSLLASCLPPALPHSLWN